MAAKKEGRKACEGSQGTDGRRKGEEEIQKKGVIEEDGLEQSR